MLEDYAPASRGPTFIPSVRGRDFQLPSRPAENYAIRAPWFFPLTRAFFLQQCFPMIYPFTKSENGSLCLRSVGFILSLPFLSFALVGWCALSIPIDVFMMASGCGFRRCSRKACGTVAVPVFNDHEFMMRHFWLYRWCVKSEMEYDNEEDDVETGACESTESWDLNSSTSSCF